MLDESQRLREIPHLLALLSHYAQQGAEDRASWRDRLMQMEDVEPRQLSALHGELIAFDWIEQNTGQALMLANGTLSACYRITVNGLREYRRIHGVEIEESEAPEKSQPRFAKKKKEKAEVLAVAASEELLVHGEKIEEERSESPQESPPRFPRKRKQKSDSPEALAVAASEESLVPAA